MKSFISAPAFSKRYVTIAVIVFVAVLLLLIAKMIYIISTLHMGFDLSDEGMHMLMYKNPGEYPFVVHNYQYIITAFINPENVTLGKLRWWWILSEVFSSVVFCWGSIALLRSYTTTTNITIGFLMLIGFNAIGLSIHDRIIAYNALSNFLLYTAAGLTFLVCSKAELNRTCKMLIVAGFSLITVECFVKASAGAGAFFMTLLLLLLTFRSQFWSIITLAVLGLLLGLGFMFTVVLPPPGVWLTNYQKGLELATTSGYGSSIMVVYLYALPTLQYLIFFLIANIPAYFFLKWMFKKNGYSENLRLLFIVCGHLVSSVVLLMLFQSTASYAFNYEILETTSTAYYAYILWIPNSIVYQLVVVKAQYGKLSLRMKAGKLTAFIYLTALPYLIIFGSFSALDVSLYGHLLPLLVLLIIGCMYTKGVVLKHKLILYYSVYITLTCICFFNRHYIEHPTRMLHPLFTQKVSSGSPQLPLLDSPTVNFLNNLKWKLQEENNTSVCTQIGLQPGLVYLLNFTQPGNSFYLSVSIPEETDKMFHSIELMNARYNDYFYKVYAHSIAKGAILINAGVPPAELVNLNHRMNEIGQSVFLEDSVFNPYLAKEMEHNIYLKSPYTYIYQVKQR